MHGTAFVAFEELVVARFGAERFEDLVDAIGHRLETTEPFVGPLRYPPEDFTILLDELAAQTGEPRDMLAREVGARAFARFVHRQRELVAGHRDLRGLLATLERGGHFASSIALARSGNLVRAELAATARHCAVTGAFLCAAAAHFDHPRAIREVACVTSGDRTCAWEIEIP